MTATKESNRLAARRWRERHPDRDRETRERWRSNPENHAKELAYSRKYHQRPEAKANAKRWKFENRERIRRQALKLYIIRKVEVLGHYSIKPYPACVRCGEVDIRVLTIDHINGGGNRERKANTTRTYEWLLQRGLPPGYQCLCANCNLRKRWENDENRKWRREPGPQPSPPKEEIEMMEVPADEPSGS